MVNVSIIINIFLVILIFASVIIVGLKLYKDSKNNQRGNKLDLENNYNYVIKKIKNNIPNFEEEKFLRWVKDIITTYEEGYSKEEIKQQGISEEAINAGKEILKTTDKESVKEIIKNDIDFDKIQEKIDSGATINQAVKETVKETSTDKKIPES